MINSITLENVTLDVPIYDASRSFRKSMINYCIGGNILQRGSDCKFLRIRALDDINLFLEPGDRVGLVGHNGAGKTSLLRLLAGVYKPTQGRIEVQGKITSLFNISIGMELDDTGLENISTIGMFLGMTPKEIRTKQEDIISFSGLGDFIHLPVRTYSQGMQLRLTFAIATALEPEILLMDEGISAGDAQFSEMANMRLNNFYNNVNILVIASHSEALIRQLCNKAILLEKGKIITAGSVNEVLAFYKTGEAMMINAVKD